MKIRPVGAKLLHARLCRSSSPPSFSVSKHYVLSEGQAGQVCELDRSALLRLLRRSPVYDLCPGVPVCVIWSRQAVHGFLLLAFWFVTIHCDHCGIRSEFGIALELDLSDCSTEFNDGPERIH